MNRRAAPSPPLERLVSMENNTIVGNVHFLLDWAIIGFAKASTTTMWLWLCTQHPESYCPVEKKIRDLQDEALAEFVVDTEGPYKRG